MLPSHSLDVGSLVLLASPRLVRARRQLIFAGSALVGFGYACVALGVFEAMFVIATLSGMGCFVLAAISHGAIVRANGNGRWRAVLSGIGVWTGITAVQAGAQIGSMIIRDYLGNGFARGRQVREKGKIVLAPVAASAKWIDDRAAIDAPIEVAAAWRENGRTEHASVAAFAQLTLELMSLDAPPALIRAAQEDGLDELRHTELCFGLARAIDGQAQGPRAFPLIAPPNANAPRLQRLQRLAVSSLFDGFLHEGVSARIIARLARVCEVPAIREVLFEIAADEGRHAAHAWHVVEWCVSEGGDAVVAALRGAVRELPRTMDPQVRGGDGTWQRFGIHGDALAADEYRSMLVLLYARVSGTANAPLV